MDEVELLLKGKQLKKLYKVEYQGIYDEYGLKSIEIDLIYLLSLAGEENTSRDLASFGAISKAHVSKAIESLRKKRLIRVEEDEKDRRCSHLYITEAGEKCLQDIRGIRKRMIEVLYRNITEEEKQVLADVAKKVACNIREECNKNNDENSDENSDRNSDRSSDRNGK